MNPVEAALCLLLALGALMFAVRASRQNQERQGLMPTSLEADRLREEVRELRERLQVLERVIIDNHSATDLDRRIERLRD